MLGLILCLFGFHATPRGRYKRPAIVFGCARCRSWVVNF